MEQDLFCTFIHHNNPYLKLGPFKYEIHHQNPEIGVIHDFASAKELEIIKSNARGHMKSTPYVTGATENPYSKLRTSKVTYMNEKIVKFVQPLSRKIAQVTKFRLKEEKYASENFQVMNYGIGGRISGHLNSTGKPVYSYFYHLTTFRSCYLRSRSFTLSVLFAPCTI